MDKQVIINADGYTRFDIKHEEHDRIYATSFAFLTPHICRLLDTKYVTRMIIIDVDCDIHKIALDFLGEDLCSIKEECHCANHKDCQLNSRLGDIIKNKLRFAYKLSYDKRYKDTYAVGVNIDDVKVTSDGYSVTLMLNTYTNEIDASKTHRLTYDFMFSEVIGLTEQLRNRISKIKKSEVNVLSVGDTYVIKTYDLTQLFINNEDVESDRGIRSIIKERIKDRMTHHINMAFRTLQNEGLATLDLKFRIDVRHISADSFTINLYYTIHND